METKTNVIQERDNVRQKKRSALFICILASLAGLLFGLDFGVITGALPFISKEMNLSNVEQEWVVATMMFGAALGAIGTKWISHHLGRRMSLLLSAVLFIVSSGGAAMAHNVEVLYIMRICLGFAIGVASFSAPLYLSEIAAENVRGSMIALYQLMITVGILLAYLSDLFFSQSGNWRAMLGIMCIPALVMFLGVLALPKSPRWLVLKGRSEGAFQVLLKLRPRADQAKKELEEIHASLKEKQGGWAIFKSNKNVKRAVFLGMLLQIMQQFTGMNVIFYYAPKIFALAGFSNPTQQIWGTVLVGACNMLATFITISLVDRLGRKPLLIISFIMIAIGMAVLSLLLGRPHLTLYEQYLAVGMMMFSIVGYAMGAAPLIWVLCSEIQPLATRDFGITCSTATNWIANMIVGATFLSLLAAFGASGTFATYVVLNVVFVFLVIYLIPETKNVTLEHIEKNLMQGKPMRSLGN